MNPVAAIISYCRKGLAVANILRRKKMASDKFKWEGLALKVKKYHRDYIIRNPYPCDNCGDIYYRSDLYRYENEEFCKKCSKEIMLEEKK